MTTLRAGSATRARAVGATVLALALTGTLAAPRPADAATRSPAANVATPASTAQVGGLSEFRSEAFRLRRSAAGELPLKERPIALTPAGRPMDGAVVMYRHRLTGRLHNHPVVQATHIMGWLASYDRTGDRRYLDRAVANGDRLLEESVSSRGGLFFPYRFDFDLHGRPDLRLDGPWYSGMAQGEVLAALLRLEQATGQERWRRAADATFTSFTLPRSSSDPWVVDVDAQGLLWFEEYPHGRHSDRAYNGHNFAVMGVYEYWNATADPRAEALVRGGLTATLAYAPSIRVAGGYSLYCLTHDVPSVSYHGVHINQLASFYSITGDPRFATWSDRFLADAPMSYGGGTGRLAWGTHQILTRSASGAVVRTSTIRPTRAATVTYDRREKIPGRAGVWLRFGAGPQKGRWVRETPGRAFVSGRIEIIDTAPRPVRVKAGTLVGFRLDARGRRVSTIRRTFRAASSAAVDSRAVVDGTPTVRFATGAMAGTYVRVDGAISLS